MQIWKTGLILILFLLITLFCLWRLDRLYPLPLKGRPLSTVVTADDGTPLRAFPDTRGVWRYPSTPGEVSPYYLQALIGYEDRWFYYHPGVNPFSICRAGFQNLTSGRVVSGGSTLTMQVARILVPDKRNLRGKIRQILRAFQLEWHLSKSDILTIYLNHAPFGSTIEGVKTASHTWLGKDSAELSRAEAALLAVLPQAPSRYRPDRHPERAKQARDKVLARLEKYGVWSKKACDRAGKEPVIALRFTPPLSAPLAARRLYSQNPGQNRIESFLDFDLQDRVQQIVGDYISHLPRGQSGAALVVNHKTLETKVYVGSADFTSTSRKGHVDMIRAMRSPGSTLKPFLYGLALDEGLIHSHSLLLDTPRFTREYEPGNFTGGFTGPVSVAKALQMSLNIPAVQVLEAYGPQRFYDRLKNGGARVSLPGRPNLSIVLGGMGTRLESLVMLYTAIAGDGLAGRPRLDKEDPVEKRYVMSPGAAWIIRKILSRPMPGQEGISRLAGHVPVAWKTGTSFGFRDAWAIGIMGDYVAGVWVGRPDGSPCPGQYGAVTAIPLLRRILTNLPPSGGLKKQPASVAKKTICWPLGRAEERSGEHCRIRFDAWILDGKIPPSLEEYHSKYTSLLQTIWVDSNGNRAMPGCGGKEKKNIALWPLSVEPWLPPSWRREKVIPPASKECPDLAFLPSNRLHITSIADKSILTRPSGKPHKTEDNIRQTLLSPGETFIPLQAMGGQGRLYWFLNRKPVSGSGGSISLAMPGPGKYQLAVTDESGRSDQVHFEVIPLN